MRCWNDIRTEVLTDKIHMLQEVMKETKDMELKRWLNSRINYYHGEVNRINT
ncbi:hypothetical protein D307_gp038 [Bacillus phage Bastille]|uniref:Uncharacterized protein n=1 Tax=Bacillus phage Bastille TaxID=57477 RepID=J9PMF1_9CAUD|nr:hypothetical protein D307_gp038 [Bacillus phage Bastille]AEQ34426.1 hypothetical protein [Bacillus phage Bastille]AZF89125.1 hypothetical protein Goe5_c00170 [Bacillus phage vB_BthM-Goe5]